MCFAYWLRIGDWQRRARETCASDCVHATAPKIQGLFVVKLSSTSTAHNNLLPKFCHVHSTRPNAFPLPSTSKLCGSGGKQRTESTIEQDFEQACRLRWRTLAVAIKAKLGIGDNGLSTVEREFLAVIVKTNGLIVGEILAPHIQEIASSGKVPALMPNRGRAP